jgi:FKBP-type peptidyl-prolyl cis-trans isomerase FkpA
LGIGQQEWVRRPIAGERADAAMIAVSMLLEHPVARSSTRIAPQIARAAAGLLAVMALQAGAQPDLLKAASAEPGAVVTESGLVYRTLKEGAGPSPEATDVVRVHYRGTFADGKEFDSSHSRGKPASFPLDRVIKCWTEGLQRMKVGGKAKLTCPAAIAYGERGTPGGPIPPNTVLQFEVELLGVTVK